MPKIIENLDEEIARTALELFKENPYQSVSMREIASEVGIAVGTLYNYYPNKWELYMEVFEESWRKTYEILKNNCRELHEDYLINYLEIIYQEMKNKKSIVRELFRFIMNDLEIDEKAKKEKFKRVRFPKVLINQIYDLFVAVLEKEFEIDLEDEKLYRIFTMIQTHIPLLQQNFAEEEENIQFLYEVVSSYIEKHYKITAKKEI
ncbi:MAG: TetR/AcrR family transcriptional regulator [Halanaerobium sp.]